jgi:hypothetical protein
MRPDYFGMQILTMAFLGIVLFILGQDSQAQRTRQNHSSLFLNLNTLSVKIVTPKASKATA